MQRLLDPHAISLSALIVIPLIFVPVPGAMDYFYQPKVYGMLFFSLIYLWLLLKEKSQIRGLIQPDAINKALLVYFSLLTVSLFFAEDLNLALSGEFLRYEGYSTLILYFLLFLAARQAKPDAVITSVPLLLSACLVAAYGIFQHYGWDPFPRDIIRTYWQVAFSTMGNQNFLGTFLVLMLPLSLHFALQQKVWYSPVFYSVIFYCLLASRTNSALVGILFGLSAYFLLTWIWRLKLAHSKSKAFSILFLTLILFFVFNVQTGNSTLFEISAMKTDFDAIIQKNANYQQAGSNRLFIWVRVLELVKQRPFFGYGIENLGPVMEREYHDDILSFWGVTHYIDKTHNEYLHTAFTAGVPALLAYLLLIVLVIKRGLLATRKNANMLPLFAAVIGYLAQAFFNISVVSVAYVFWIFLGLLSHHARSKTIEDMYLSLSMNKSS